MGRSYTLYTTKKEKRARGIARIKHRPSKPGIAGSNPAGSVSLYFCDWVLLKLKGYLSDQQIQIISVFLNLYRSAGPVFFYFAVMNDCDKRKKLLPLALMYNMIKRSFR